MIAVDFCDPYSPWQKESKENMNGLVRQYLPKAPICQVTAKSSSIIYSLKLGVLHFRFEPALFLTPHTFSKRTKAKPATRNERARHPRNGVIGTPTHAGQRGDALIWAVSTDALHNTLLWCC